MSKRVLSTGQLAMFMKPSELKANLVGSVDGIDVHDDADWHDSKHLPRLQDSIRQSGVRTPVILDHGQPGYGEGPVMGNGHHRLHNAHLVEQDGVETYVPVLHTEGNYMGDGPNMKKAFPAVFKASYTGFSA